MPQMTSRERVIKALEFKHPDRVPRNLWKLPGLTMFRKKELDEILELFPEDIAKVDSFYGKGNRVSGERYKQGQPATDEWGCVWRAAEDGVAGEVKEAPIKDLSDIRKLIAPYEVLRNADTLRVNESCANTDKFTLAWTSIRPFERMQFLLGPERLYMELFYQPEELFLLRKIVHDFFMEELELWINTKVNGILFMDDWGSQRSLLVSPNLWRDFFKPLYKEYCDRIHSAKKFALFHSDGYIEPLCPDLIEIGTDAVNAQLFCMNIEELGRKYRGQITFWGEIDRQQILPFGTKGEVAAAVKRVKEALWLPEGGVIAQCEFGLRDPKENIRTVFETWEAIA